MRALYKIVMRVVGGSTAELNELVTGIELPRRKPGRGTLTHTSYAECSRKVW